MVLFAGINTFKTYRTLTETIRYEEVGRATSVAMSATVAMSLERSVVQVALALDEPIPQAFRDIVSEQRVIANDGLKDAVARIEATPYLATAPEYISQTLGALERVDRIREEIDAQLSLPISERNAKRAYDLPFELKSEVVALKNTTDLLRNHLAMATSLAGVLDTVQQRAWEVREFGGRARTYFAIATARQEAIPNDYLGSIDLDNKRANEAWTSLKNAIRATDLSPSLFQAVEEAASFYFDDYVTELQSMLDASASPTGGQIYAMEFQEFFEFSNEALGMMEALSVAAGDELIRYLVEREKGATIWMIVNATLAFSLAVGIASVALLLNKNVIRKLSDVTETLSKVSKGDLEAVVEVGKREVAEISTLAGAVDDIRQKQLALLAAEEAAAKEAENKKKAEVERQKAEAAMRSQQEEQERLSREQAEADRKKMLASLGSSLGAVVSAASRGDFSKRVDANFDDQELARLADDVNTLVNSVGSGISRAGEALARVAGGDLSEEMAGVFEGEFKTLQVSTNTMITSLRDLIGGMASSTEKLATSSSELRETSDVLSKQAEQNAASLEETSAALQELTSSIKQVDQNISDANGNAGKASETAKESLKVASEAADAMSKINDASKEIAKVVNVINEISFQINLLALNAGVEAARAGDAGRGFAVVASEVRSLASRATDAAKEIADVISSSDAAVSIGVAKVEEAEQSLQAISKSVIEISNSVSEVAESVSDQVGNVSDINGAISQIDNNTQQQAFSFEKVTSTSKLLSGEAAGLKEASSQFRLESGSGSRVRVA